MSLGLPERVEHERAALMLLTELDDSLGLANLYLNIGASAGQDFRVFDAVSNFRASSDYYQRAGDVVGAALADNNLAEVLTLQHKLDAAEGLLTNARRVTEAANYPYGTFTTISGLSRIAAWRGKIDQALRLQNESLIGFRELRADDLVVDSLVRLVEIHVIAGDSTTALSVAGEAVTLLAQRGEMAVIEASLARLTARALVLEGEAREAREMFERAISLASRDGSRYEEALASMGIARLDGDEERLSAALAQLSELGVDAPPPGS